MGRGSLGHTVALVAAQSCTPSAASAMRLSGCLAASADSTEHASVSSRVARTPRWHVQGSLLQRQDGSARSTSVRAATAPWSAMTLHASGGAAAARAPSAWRPMFEWEPEATGSCDAASGSYGQLSGV